MNILILLARGIEACGVTRLTIEIEQQLRKNGHNTKVVAGIDKRWNRENGQPNDFLKHKFLNGIYKDEEKYDACIITSVPPIKITKDIEKDKIVFDNFIGTLNNLKENNTRIIYLQCDHKLHSIYRNFYHLDEYILPFFNSLDRVIVHDIRADFITKYIKKKIPERKFTIGQQVQISTDFDETYSQITKSDKKIDKTCWFIGRSPRWKGWTDLRTLHMETLKDKGWLSGAEGIELSIQAKQFMCNVDENNVYTWRDDNLYYKHHFKKSAEYVLDHADEYRYNPLLVFDVYNRLEGLSRINRVKFGMFFTFLGENFGGPLENCLLEIVACHTVPVIKKELYDAAFFNDHFFKDFGTPEELGIILYDSNNPNECEQLMQKLNDDNNLYNKYVERAFTFFKSQFNRDYIINRIFDKCISDEDDLKEIN